MSGIENENDFSLDFLLNLKNDLLDTLKCVDKEIKRIKKNNNIDSSDSDSSDSDDCNDSSDNDSNDSEKTLYGPCTDSCCS
jgi:hypothetical protein